jgi:hypothetical protein
LIIGENRENVCSASTHAEVDVLNKWKQKCNERGKIKKMGKLSLFVGRFSKTCQKGESRPCRDCLQAYLDAGIGIRYVYYTTASGKTAREKLSEMFESPKTYVSSGNRGGRKRGRGRR